MQIEVVQTFRERLAWHDESLLILGCLFDKEDLPAIRDAFEPILEKQETLARVDIQRLLMELENVNAETHEGGESVDTQEEDNSEEEAGQGPPPVS